jgi:hypothetical protein
MQVAAGMEASKVGEQNVLSWGLQAESEQLVKICLENSSTCGYTGQQRGGVMLNCRVLMKDPTLERLPKRVRVLLRAVHVACVHEDLHVQAVRAGSRHAAPVIAHHAANGSPHMA